MGQINPDRLTTTPGSHGKQRTHRPTEVLTVAALRNPMGLQGWWGSTGLVNRCAANKPMVITYSDEGNSAHTDGLPCSLVYWSEEQNLTLTLEIRDQPSNLFVVFECIFLVEVCAIKTINVLFQFLIFQYHCSLQLICSWSPPVWPDIHKSSPVLPPAPVAYLLSSLNTAIIRF